MRGNGGAKHGAVAMVTATVTVGTSSLTRPGAARQKGPSQRLSTSPDSDCVENVLSDRFIIIWLANPPPLWGVSEYSCSHTRLRERSASGTCASRFKQFERVVRPPLSRQCLRKDVTPIGVQTQNTGAHLAGAHSCVLWQRVRQVS